MTLRFRGISITFSHSMPLRHHIGDSVILLVDVLSSLLVTTNEGVSWVRWRN
jgi:hypothetical protein